MEKNNDLSREMYFDKDFRDITSKAGKSTKANFDKEMDVNKELGKIEIPGTQNKIIFTSGKDQLAYQNGEFFLKSTTDSTVAGKKLTRKEATDMYTEFVITNYLNPLIAKRRKEGIISKGISSRKAKEATRVSTDRTQSVVRKTPETKVKSQNDDLVI